jgi:hypothetical protein
MSERWCSSRRHPVSGLGASLVAGSLPRFVAAGRAGPGLRVGSALDGGPDWADGAITRNGRLVAREVDGGVVVALVPAPAPAAGPVLVPPDVLHVPAGMAGLRGRIPPAGDDQAGAVPAGLVGELAAGLGQGGTLCRIYTRFQRDRCPWSERGLRARRGRWYREGISSQQETDLGAGPIRAGPGRGLDPHHRAAGTSRPPGEPGDLPAHVSLLAGRGHPRMQTIRPGCEPAGTPAPRASSPGPPEPAAFPPETTRTHPARSTHQHTGQNTSTLTTAHQSVSSSQPYGLNYRDVHVLRDRMNEWSGRIRSSPSK